MEFVAVAPCASPDDLAVFYRRQGAWLALLHVVAATDVHFQNVLAAGAHPVVIDLEGLFHPHAFPHTRRSADDRVAEILEEWVMGIGLLPSPRQRLPQAPRSQAVATDKMHVGREQVSLGERLDQATLGGETIESRRYAERFEAGFDRAYRLLLQHRDELRTMIAQFADDPVRLVIRRTMFYTLLLAEASHPKVLQRGPDRNRLGPALDGRGSAAVAHPLHRRQAGWLEVDDVPYFSVTPTSHHRVERTGMEIATEAHRMDGRTGSRHQLWFVRGALAHPAHGDPLGAPGRPRGEQRTAAQRHRKLVLPQRGRDFYEPSCIGNDLYDGLPGVILYLAYPATASRGGGAADAARPRSTVSAIATSPDGAV